MSDPNSPMNMLPFTNAARLPNIGLTSTLLCLGTRSRKRCISASVGRGICMVGTPYSISSSSRLGDGAASELGSEEAKGEQHAEDERRHGQVWLDRRQVNPDQAGPRGAWVVGSHPAHPNEDEDNDRQGSEETEQARELVSA